MSRWQLAVLLLAGPVLALVAVDRALVGSAALWEWVATEVPRRSADPYLVEGLVRSAPRGRHNLLVLGNSTADDGIDEAALERALAPRETRVLNLTVAGSRPLQYAMLAPQIAPLEARLAILVTDAAALSGRSSYDGA